MVPDWKFTRIHGNPASHRWARYRYAKLYSGRMQRRYRSVYRNTGRAVVYNDPFYTTDAVDLQAWSHAEAKHTSSVYIGIVSTGSVAGIYTANYYTPHQPFYVDRQNSGGSVVGSWNVPDSRTGSQSGLSHFKHCGVMRGGIYKIGWNGELPNGTGFLHRSHYSSCIHRQTRLL